MTNIAQRIRKAELNAVPFLHLYVDRVFDLATYSVLREHLPQDKAYVPLAGYPARFIHEPTGAFWKEVVEAMRDVQDALTERLDVPRGRGHVLLIRDHPGYSIGPHTDSPNKLFSALFYLPPDESLREHGTTLYESASIDTGLKHYARSDHFKPVWTAPFLPNTMFAFKKSNHSWHGVEPFSGDGVRDVLLLYTTK